jgi:hypothetical protein
MSWSLYNEEDGDDDVCEDGCKRNSIMSLGHGSWDSQYRV